MAKTGNTFIQTKENQLLKPKYDIVFQRLFNKTNEKITKAFVEALLEKPIDEIVINEEKEVLGKTIEDKTGILDLQLSIEGKEKVDVEVQLVNRKNLEKRLLFYFSKLYLKDIEAGQDYNVGKRVVLFAILDYELEYTKFIKEMETIWNLREKNHAELILTDAIEIHIITLDKVKENYYQNKKNKKAQWMLFLDDPNSEEVLDIMKKNEEIKEAVVKVHKMSKDEQLQRLADLKLKAIMDEKAIYAAGVDQGIKEGIKQGIKQGQKEGAEESKKEIAKRLLERNVKIEDIIAATGLSEMEIETLK